MCGISGFIPDSTRPGNARETVERMNARLRHRGPDNQASWNELNTCLGHTRLSIIDLSDQSNQPFTSDDGRYVIVYNGELYNYQELKLELQRAPIGSGALPYFFKTRSDTEVVVAAFARWGIECIHRFNGMFAFAVYDRQEKKLWVVRDRLGVKPLYYYYGPEGLVFASELRAILHSGLRKFVINSNAISEYLMFQTVHAPSTIVKGISMLMPGHYLEYSDGKANISRYYDLNNYKTVDEGLSYEQVCGQVFQLLGASVQRRLVSDVPFGAFLSGGIDSSAVVALMSQVSPGGVDTFNINFDETEFSEAVYAQLIAKKYNTRHHQINLRPADFLHDLPEALAAMDHPSGDGPNTYVVSKATKKAGITMALSGIGGDELFAGYAVFGRMAALEKKSWVNHVPRFARRTAAALMRSRAKTVSAHKTADLLAEPSIDFDTAYKYSRSLFSIKELKRLKRGGDPFTTVSDILQNIPQHKDHLLTAVSLAEMQTYMQNVLLRDTDQMSMAVALEVREPFLDHTLVDFVLGVPDHFKYPVTPKKLLTDSLGALLPREIIDRPKMGFTLPWQQWLRNDLRDFADQQITSFAEKNLCDPTGIRDLWTRFLKNDPLVTWSRIWHIVVLNHWIETNEISIS